MYLLKPTFHETIWGGHQLKRFNPEITYQIGHMYLVNGHSELSNEILNGNYAGMSLHNLFEIKKKEWNLAKYKEFPLTIALVDAKENLSIQVHPDGQTAQKLEGNFMGKKESWLFLKEPENGWIYAGCNCSSIKDVQQAVSSGDVEKITKHFPISINDYICINAGTLHAMTAGSLTYEVEFGSDYTYRFYDYERENKSGEKRELHITKALSSIKPDNTIQSFHYLGDRWISEDEYEIRNLKNISVYTNTGTEIECISIMEGAGVIDSCLLSPGITILLLPGEEIKNVKIYDAYIARMKR